MTRRQSFGIAAPVEGPKASNPLKFAEEEEGKAAEGAIIRRQYISCSKCSSASFLIKME
jgi:hypothetical protein